MNHNVTISKELNYDLLVCGAGPSGLAAALAARKEGLSVLLRFSILLPRDVLCYALMALLIPILAKGDTEGSPPSKPNVILVMIDDLNDWVGFQNKSSLDAITPNMDRLALEGMVFSNAHSSAPECAPSRTSFMSGLEPSTTGIYYNRDNWMPFIPVEQMLPAVLKANGYSFVCVWKVMDNVVGVDLVYAATSYCLG